MKRRRYDLEFKQRIIQQVQEIGNAAAVARQHELNPKLIYRWMKELDRPDLEQLSLSAKKQAAFVPTAEDYKELARENERLKKLLAEQALEAAILKDLLKKTNPHLKIK